MLRRLDSAVPTGTNIVILQPGANDLRFGFSKEQRAANIAEMVKRLRAHDIRVIVFDPKIPEDLYQWDHIHFNVAAHANIAARLAAEIAAEPLARPATPIATHPASTRQP
jgi:acyl-CoA thioesterase I